MAKGGGGASFVELLKDVDYPGASELDPGSLDWMFDDARAAQFLKWLVGSISRENVVSPEICKRYDELKADGRVVHGDALRAAMQSLEAGGGSSQLNSIEDMQKEIAELRARSDQLSDREQLLRCLSGDLSSQAQSLRLRSSSLEAHEAAEKQQLLGCLRTCEQDVAKVGSTVQTLSESVEAIVKLYAAESAVADVAAGSSGASDSTQHGGGASGAQRAADGAFLSLASLDGYLAAEVDYSSAITAYTNKKFFEAIGDVASHKDDDYYMLLDVANPQTIVARGCTNQDGEVSEECKELLRIQKTYPTSQLHLVNAQLDQAYSAAALGAARSNMADLTSLVSCDGSLLSAELAKLTAQCGSKRRQIAKQRDGPLSALLLKSAGASEARVLTGNYNLKLARQNYFLSSQDQVIDKLLGQRARFELLSMLLEVEARHHRETRSLICTVRASLRSELEAYSQRSKALEDACFAESKYERSTVDSRCSWLMTASELLGIKGTSIRPFVTYLDIADSTRSLCSRLDEAQATQELLRQRGVSVVKCLDGAVEQAMSGVCSPAVEQQRSEVALASQLRPLDFAPKALTEVGSKLERDLAALETSVLELLKTVEQKKKLLRQDSIGKVHRQLFRAFYTEPHRLKDILNVAGSA